MAENIDYQELNERVEKALQQRKRLTGWIMFIMSVLMFLLFAGLAWFFVATGVDTSNFTNPDMDATTTAMVFLTLGGFMTLMFHAIGMATDSGMFDKQLRSRILMEEFGENLQELAQMKRKRSAAQNLSEDEQEVELTDDGELIPVKARKQ